MTKARVETLAADLENAIYRGNALLADAEKLTRQIARLDHYKLPFDEPVRIAQKLVSVAATVSELAAAILRKAASQEHDASVERRAQLEGKAAEA